eukprot:gene6484-6247_t
MAEHAREDFGEVISLAGPVGCIPACLMFCGTLFAFFVELKGRVLASMQCLTAGILLAAITFEMAEELTDDEFNTWGHLFSILGGFLAGTCLMYTCRLLGSENHTEDEDLHEAQAVSSIAHMASRMADPSHKPLTRENSRLLSSRYTALTSRYRAKSSIYAAPVSRAPSMLSTALVADAMRLTPPNTTTRAVPSPPTPAPPTPARPPHTLIP